MRGSDLKTQLLQDIIRAAEKYQSNLCNKVFLYVQGKRTMEVQFTAANFLHLTGVKTHRSPRSFYRAAINHQLSKGDFYWKDSMSLYNISRKLAFLQNCEQFQQADMCSIKNFQTKTAAYPFAYSNRQFAIGIGIDSYVNGDQNRPICYPQTLRYCTGPLLDRICSSGHHIDFILSREKSEPKYSHICMAAANLKFPRSLSSLVEKETFKTLRKGQDKNQSR